MTAGTFIVRGKATAASIRREILAQVSFEPQIVIRPAGEILALVRSDPFRGVGAGGRPFNASREF